MTGVQQLADPPITSAVEAWQKVIALDVSYLHKRAQAAVHLNPARWNLYLRRRYQLSQNAATPFSVNRSEYLYIRQNLLTQKRVKLFMSCLGYQVVEYFLPWFICSHPY